MLLKDQIEIVRSVLLDERAWRERVFYGRRQEKKLREIDRALETLEQLESRLRDLVPDQFPEQLGLGIE